jgi:hypothetical protein
MNKIVLKKGGLPGYKLDMSTEDRRDALKKAVNKNGYLPIMRRVNVLSIFLRRSSPDKAKRAEQDKNWLKSNFGSGDTRKSKGSRKLSLIHI